MQDLSDRIFELRTDFGEDNAENDAIRIPAHEISLAGGFQKNRRHLRHEAVGCFAFTKFTCVQQHQNKWLSRALRPPALKRQQDRKSTRLNSSHSQISYAVFCLKKKTNT